MSQSLQFFRSVSTGITKKVSLVSPSSEIPEILNHKKLHSIDGIRAVSILLVIASHVNHRFDNSIVKLICGDGKLGVYVFFVISGFLITTLLIKEKVNKGDISLKNFYARRFFRIIPVAALYISSLFVLNLFFDLHIESREMIGAMFFLMNYSYFHKGVWFAGHFWSLSVEEQFYLLFPFLFKKNYKAYIYFLFSFLAFIICVRYFNQYMRHIHRTNFFMENREAIDYFDGIIIGSLLSILIYHRVIKTTWIVKNKILLHIILVPVILVVFNKHTPHFYEVLFGNLNTVICSVLVSVLLVSNLEPGKDLIFRFLNNKYIKTIGLLSYSLYVYNMIFTANKHYPYTSSVPTYYWPMALNLALLFLVSYLSYNYFEKPILKLKNRFV